VVAETEDNRKTKPQTDTWRAGIDIDITDAKYAYVVDEKRHRSTADTG
jgi:hypothetical protein